MSAVAGLVVGLAVGARVAQRSLADDATRPPDPAPTSTSRTAEPAAPDPTTVARPTDLVVVDEVWLVAADDVYDWGVAVRTATDGVIRSDVTVEVRLLDEDDEIVERVVQRLDAVTNDRPAVVAGRTVEPDDAPVRLEFDLDVGRTAGRADAVGVASVLEQRRVERVGDTLTGRIRSAAEGPIDSLTALFVWRDADGTILAAVPLDVGRVRPGVDAVFELDLAPETVPDGEPDDVMWTP